MELNNTIKKTDDLSITDLIDIDTLQKLQDCFADATGVASIITDPNGIPITKPSNFCRLCIDIIRKTEKGLTNCMHSDAELGRMNPTGPIMQPCLSGGLWDGGASITIGNRHIANWLIGQVRNDNISREQVMGYADVIGADREDFGKALDEVTVMSTGQFEKVCSALFIFANHISELAYKNMALNQSERNLSTTLDSIGDAVITTDESMNVMKINPVAEQVTGWSSDDGSGKHLEDILNMLNADTKTPVENPAKIVFDTDKILSVPSGTLLKDRNGNEKPVSYSAAPIHSIDGRISGVVIVFRDESSRMILEEQLRQSQKMEAIGRLAGGVAHDFNNMLCGIQGAADLLYGKHKNDPSSERLISIIIEAVERTSSLTRQMLDFSRVGKRESSSIDIHKLIVSVVSILERSVDKKVTIATELEASGCIIRGDSAQLQSALLNLGINARDAMPRGGIIRISSANIDVEEKYTGYLYPDLATGRYIEISFSDTGVGIPSEIQKRIFDPFFTTKETGKGTGLGLSAVYGTIKDHRGTITVFSEDGYGSVFKIYLPLANGIPANFDRSETFDHERCRIGRILFVDDEPLLRNTGSTLLEAFGNEVITANDGAAAIEIFKNGNSSAFDLIIMDMIMPNMNGVEAYNSISAIDQSIPFIFASGFTYRQNVDELMKRPNVVEFIQKPYSLTSLGKALNHVFERKRTVLLAES